MPTDNQLLEGLNEKAKTSNERLAEISTKLGWINENQKKMITLLESPPPPAWTEQQKWAAMLHG